MPLPDDEGRGGDPGPLRALLREGTGQVLAVAAIATAITVVVTLLGLADDDVRTGLPGAPAAGGSAATTPSEAASPSGPAPSPTASPPVSPTPAAPTSPTAPPRPKVDVLNQSAAGGAAKVTADRLRAAGWRIGRVDDFTGNVSTTTVYFPPGERRQARALARDLPGSPRVLEGFSTLKPRRLSVILVD